MKGTFLLVIFIDTHGMLPERMPMQIAAQQSIPPAAGVIATSPVMMPWTAPITAGFL